MLDAHRLRIFRAVVAAGSVNGAAASLGYTPSAISQHLAALQKETGLELVERVGRGIQPTGVGRAFAEESGQVLERLAALESMAGDLRAGRIGRLKVAYFASAGVTWIPPVVATVLREFPRLRLDLRLVEMVGELPVEPDVEVFVEGAAASSLDGYDVEPLLDDPYVVVLPASHPLAGADAVPLVDLRDEAWIDNDVSRGTCRRIVLDACTSRGFAPPFHVETRDYASALAFVAAGAGITVMPRLGVQTLPAGLAVRPVVEPEPVRQVRLRVRRAVRDNSAVQRTAELIREHAVASP